MPPELENKHGSTYEYKYSFFRNGLMAPKMNLAQG